MFVGAIDDRTELTVIVELESPSNANNMHLALPIKLWAPSATSGKAVCANRRYAYVHRGICAPVDR